MKFGALKSVRSFRPAVKPKFDLVFMTDEDSGIKPKIIEDSSSKFLWVVPAEMQNLLIFQITTVCI